jgi:hypothetical protein
VPSLAILAGANFQQQDGEAVSSFLAAGAMNPVALQPACIPALNPTCAPVPVSDDALVVGPFVGAALELLTPALPIPTRPRLFLGGEILPSFVSEYDVALEGDPDCIRGPEPDAPCATDETPGQRTAAFAETNANGQGIRTRSSVDTLVFGASAGLAFPFQLFGRQLRVKPGVAWIQYEVTAEGLVVDAECSPPTRCTTVAPGGINPGPGILRQPESLTASGSKTFNALGPGVDLEVDTARWGPIGSSLLLGLRAYRVLGDRELSFGTSVDYPFVDANLPAGTSTANFNVELEPWAYRVHVGFRLHWLGGS